MTRRNDHVTRHRRRRAGRGARFRAPAQSTLPPVGPERPFAPAPRVERTLSNGLRVVAVRHATVPKVTAMLTIQSGLAVDPAEKAGLAQFVVDLAQEGTDDAVERTDSSARCSRSART